MRSTVGGVTGFNRWLSQSINPDEEQDPWNDLRGEANDLDEIKMAFDDDFHLTVIPNFLHDSDAYVANLENKLERLQQIKKNPSAKEMVAAVSRARALRLKYAQMHPEFNAKPPDEPADDEDNGFLALLPMLIMPISRRFFPRLPLTKEEAQNLVKYDFLLMRHEAEMNNEVSATVEVEGYEIKDANTAPDTSWDQQQKDSGIDQPFITFDSPEANELQIPKNWASDDATQEVHHSTVNTPDDTANITRVATNRSALSLSANTSPIPEASTITSFTPTRRSEDAFYHFAYIRTSMTSTTENTKAETPSDCRASLSNAGYTRGNSNSKTAPSGQTPFSSACSMDLPYKQQSSFAPECNALVETKGLSKSSANILDGPARDQVVPTTKSSPSLKVPKDAKANGLPMSADAADKQPQETDKDNHCSEKNIREAASSDRADGNSSEGTMHEDGPASLKNGQGTISPEVTMASSPTKESVNQTKSVFEAGLERAPTGVKHSGQNPEPEVAEVTVASSMTHDSMGTGIEVPWLFEKESNMSLGGVDELEHMSSLVRASVDEDDEPPKADGNQASQISAICTPMSSTCCYSDRTQTKASEGTSGNITTNYSDPHSNLFDEESLIKKEEGHAPIIRMYSPFPRDIHVSLQGNLLSWALPRGAEQQHSPHEVVYPKLLSLPAVNSDAATHHNSPRLAPKGSKRDALAASHQRAPTIVDRLYSDSSRPSFKARLSKDTRCRKATSTKSQRSRERSSASSASSMPSAAGSQIGEKLMQLSSGKLSTSSMFKNRHRSVHWFKVIEDVDSDTVVKDCDYMLTRQVKTKVPAKNKEEPAALKVTSNPSKEQSESDRNEDSIVDKDCKKFAIRVLEEEVFIAGKVNSCLEFFEYSCTKMGGVLREQEDTAAAAKNRSTSISEIAEPMESLERHSQSTDLVTSKEFAGAVNEKEKAAVDTPELPELVEKQSKTEVTSKALDDPVAVTEGVHLNVALKDNTESLEVLSMTASSLNGDADDPVAAAERDGKKADADANDVALLSESPSPESHHCKASLVQSWEHFEADVNLQRSCATGEVAVPCGMAAGTTSKAKSCNEPAEFSESTGEQKVVTLKQELEFAKVASNATATSSKFADVQDAFSSGQEDKRDDGKQEKNITGFAKCATEPSRVSEMKAVQAAAKQDSCSTSSRDARRSPSHCNSDNKHVATSEEDKKKDAEIEDKENEGSSANRDTTVLQCHELAGTSRLSTFSASNKGVGLNGRVASNRGAEPNRAAAPNRAVEPAQRPFNMTRTLRITTTKQFKPLNLRRSITGILGSDSSLLGRSLSVQSREVMLPRSQKRPEKHKKPSATLKENGYTPSGSTKKSGSRKDATVANDQELPPSDLTARRSYSVTEAHTRASLRGSTVAVRSKMQTIRQHSCTALGDTSELAKAHANEISLEYTENEGRVKNKCKSKVKKMSQSQLPLKKRSCSRRLENRDVQTKDLEGQPLPADCKTSSRVVEANVNSAEGKGAEDLIANQEAPATWAATKPDALQGSEDVDSANPECPSQAAPEDRTISLIAESQYSASGGAEINNPTPITAILGGDTNVESVKLCQSLPSTYDCTAASTNSKDNLPPNDDTTVSATDPDDNASIIEGDKRSASVNFEHSTMPTCEPMSKCHQKKGGERDVDAEVNNSMTSSTSTASNTDAIEKDVLSVQSRSHHALHNPLAD